VAGVACGAMGAILVQQSQLHQAVSAIIVGLGGAFWGAVAVYNLHTVKKIHLV